MLRIIKIEEVILCLVDIKLINAVIIPHNVVTIIIGKNIIIFNIKKL